MALSLHTVKPNKGSRRTSKRVGRGLGSKGTYSGRGVKGQSARSGVSGLKLKGMRHIMLAQPKLRGFTSLQGKSETVTLTDLSRAFADGAKVTPEAIIAKGLADQNKMGIKILATGTIAIKLSIVGCRVSAAAKEKIEKAGGTVT